MAKLYFLPRTVIKDRKGLLRVGWRVEAALVGAFFWLLGRLSLRRATAFSRLLFRAVGPLTGIHTKLLRNLAIIHPEAPMTELKGRAREAFGWLGVAVAEIAHIADIRARMDDLVEFDIHPSVEATLRDPEAAAVLVTAHVGPWTLTNLIAGYFDFPLTIVYAPESNPYIRQQIFDLRAALPVTQIERDGSMRALLKELSKGHKIGLGSDVRLAGGEPVPLFGHDMETNTVPARLALRQQCPLIPIGAERLPDGRFRIVAEAAITPDNPEASTDVQVDQMARGLSAVYERWIREQPQQWMAMARRWPKALELASVARAEARDSATSP